MYCKENRQSMAEKGPPIGRVDIFQTGPKEPLMKCAYGALRIFCVRNSLLKLEIHKVFPRFRAFFWRKISLKSLLPISSVVP